MRGVLLSIAKRSGFRFKTRLERGGEEDKYKGAYVLHPTKSGILASPDPPYKPTAERLDGGRMDGAKCCRCGEWSPLARPNCEDGRFECWSCRHYPWRPGLYRDDK